MNEGQRVHRWGRFEVALEVELDEGSDPLRDVEASAEFTSPSGRQVRVPAFWDGDSVWRARLAPDEVGEWEFTIEAEVNEDGSGNGGSSMVAGTFECVPYTGDNPLYRHGPIRMAADRRSFVHADGTPWFFLADTVWNGAMLSTPEEWAHYIRTRTAQDFTAAQLVSTQWRTAPDGGPHGPTYEGGERLERLNPGFFQYLDRQFDALAEAGLVTVPVLLWAIGGGQFAETNPGNVLSEEDAALLASYQVARWQAHPVVWIINGDGRYTGEAAERWQRIGQRVFSDTDPATRAPVMTHPGGQQWVGQAFGQEDWLDVIGYQSGHGDDERAWRWIVQGPPATEWEQVPHQAVINLEPCYEDHLGYQSKQRIPAAYVRRACYWSLMVSPTAGVTYGGHGIWGWDDGSGPPVAHASTGTPKPWREALHLPGAEQLRTLRGAFDRLAWWTLRPDQSLVAQQPGAQDITRYITAARTEDGEQAILYMPSGGELALNTTALAPGRAATWINPRDGTGHDAGEVARGTVTLQTPDAGDWVLLLLG